MWPQIIDPLGTRKGGGDRGRSSHFFKLFYVVFSLTRNCASHFQTFLPHPVTNCSLIEKLQDFSLSLNTILAVAVVVVCKIRSGRQWQDQTEWCDPTKDIFLHFCSFTLLTMLSHLLICYRYRALFLRIWSILYIVKKHLVCIWYTAWYTTQCNDSQFTLHGIFGLAWMKLVPVSIFIPTQTTYVHGPNMGESGGHGNQFYPSRTKNSM